MKKYSAFHPGKEWLDTSGNRIQAHGGSVIYARSTAAIIRPILL